MRAPVALLAATTAFSLLLPATAGAAEMSATAISKDKAKKLAKAGVLTKADLKGYMAEPTEADASDAADSKALYKCLGTTAPKRVARNLGASYTKDALSIESSADVLDSTAAAKKDLAAIKSSKAAGCFKKQFNAAFKRGGGSVSSLKVTKIDVSVKGSEGVGAFHLTADLIFGDIATRVDGYFLGVVVGQTELSLGSTRFDNGKASLKQLTGLAGVLVKRVAKV